MLLAAALFVSASLSLICTAVAVAQDAAGYCPTCLANGAGVTGGMAGGFGGQLCALHGNDIQNCRPRTYGQPDLFYNYYVPGTCGGVPAAAYLAPRPVPAWVGHTYYTYQPFLPNELLYQHHRTYYRYYDQGRGMTRTAISWYRPPIYLPSHFRIAR
jgi:hypothetical protein